MNSKDVLSEYARLRRGIKPASRHARRLQHGWIAELMLPRRIAADFARGFTTSDTAAKHGLSEGRISQIRRQLESGWNNFQGEAAAVK